MFLRGPAVRERAGKHGDGEIGRCAPLRIIRGNPFHSCLRVVIIARRTPIGKHDAVLAQTLIISSRGEWPNAFLNPFLSLALIAKAAPVRASLEDLAPGRMVARRRTHLIKPSAGELRK